MSGAPHMSDVATQAGAAAHAHAPLDTALERLLALQNPDGCWEGEMVWNTMILSQYVIVRRITEAAPQSGGADCRGPIDPRSRDLIIRHYGVNQFPDGSWGMHPESAGYVFFTTLAYVALRLLEVPARDPMLTRARAWLRAQPGGVLCIPTWGKYWLSFIGLYEWSGVNPISPELFLLPSAVPFHPSKYYCHTRNIYSGLSYLYGVQFRADLGPIIKDLRGELYDTDYAAIDFSVHRHDVAQSDLHVSPGRGVKLAQDFLRLGDGLLGRTMRGRALEHCFARILYEQRQSAYQGISPVSGLLDILAIFSRDPHHPDLGPSLEGIEAWRWDDEAQGIRYSGARSNTWDTALAMQAILAMQHLPPRAYEPLRRAYRYLLSVQMTEELPGWREANRDPALGGWCFSDGKHRWPVSDCTAESLSAILLAHRVPGLVPDGERISPLRVEQAVEFILLRQNDDGGFGTYERRRGSTFLENINPTEMYGRCMTERSYLECTASSVAALCHVREEQPGGLPARLREPIHEAIGRGVRFLRASQRPDGSYPGFWGINFSYSIFHVIRGLRAAGIPANDPAITRAAQWLAGKQRSDGAWGEHWKGCLEDRYAEHERGQSVMTSWAALALCETMDPRSVPVERAARWLADYVDHPERHPDAVNGVFFGSAMLDYKHYKIYFPLWALGRRQALLSASSAPPCTYSSG